MSELDDRPEIARFGVDPQALTAPGIGLDALAAELQVELSGDRPSDTPVSGWRVLTDHDGAAQTVGAPTDAAGKWWRLGQIVRGGGGDASPRLRLHPMSMPLRVSRKERARGLELRWPDIIRSAPNIGDLAIDIVNTGPDAWLPQGDSFMVFAELRPVNGPRKGVFFGYVEGQNQPVPLGPGEYARVRVTVDSSQWDALEPGRHEVHATLVDLGLQAVDALEIELTADDIRRHTPPKPRRPAPPTPPAPE